MQGIHVVHSPRSRRTYGVLLAIASLIIAVIAVGCSNRTTRLPGAQGIWKQQGAAFAGTQACRDCHATIHDAFATQPMGDPGTGAYTRHHANLNNCGSCHVTGFGDPTGAQLDGSTPLLDGIGCESCHGPGSQHIAANSNAGRKKTITRTPPDRACWDCHGDRKAIGDGAYRPGALQEPYAPITAANYSESSPSSIRGPHHAAAAFLLGRQGYNLPAPIASPHAALPNTCLACHQQTLSPNGKVEHGALAQVPDIDTSRDLCASCHTGGRSQQLIQKGVNQLLIELAGASASDPTQPDSNTSGGLLGAYAAANGITLNANNDPTNPKVINYKGARHNIRYVMGEGSRGVHNPPFAKKLLEDAKEMLSK